MALEKKYSVDFDGFLTLVFKDQDFSTSLLFHHLHHLMPSLETEIKRAAPFTHFQPAFDWDEDEDPLKNQNLINNNAIDLGNTFPSVPSIMHVGRAFFDDPIDTKKEPFIKAKNSFSSSFFDFSLCHRNGFLLSQQGFKPPKAIKTGTTIVGITFDQGVILAADTRATNGPIVADKNCEKLHYISPRIYCAGAGTAADTEYTTNLVRSRLQLHALNSGRGEDKVRVVTAMTMLKQYLFNYQGYVEAALILGGIDPVQGPSLYTIYPHGSVDKLPFVSMGSGSLAAISVLESAWKEGMNREQAISLASTAIKAGIFNDLGSGSNVDLVVITPTKTDYLRNYEKPTPRNEKQASYLGIGPKMKILSKKVRSRTDPSAQEWIEVENDTEINMDVE